MIGSGDVGETERDAARAVDEGVALDHGPARALGGPDGGAGELACRSDEVLEAVVSKNPSGSTANGDACPVAFAFVRAVFERRELDAAVVNTRAAVDETGADVETSDVVDAWGGRSR